MLALLNPNSLKEGQAIEGYTHQIKIRVFKGLHKVHKIFNNQRVSCWQGIRLHTVILGLKVISYQSLRASLTAH